MTESPFLWPLSKSRTNSSLDTNDSLFRSPLILDTNPPPKETYNELHIGIQTASPETKISGIEIDLSQNYESLTHTSFFMAIDINIEYS